MVRALLSIIHEGIENDFWGEDSILVDKFYDINKEQLDCEGISASYAGDGESIVVAIGNKEYRIIVREEI